MMPTGASTRARRVAKLACALATALSIALEASGARADPAWTSRRMTLLQGEFGVDLGFGLADDSRDSVVGTGVYAQVGYGITNWLEVYVRDGVRFGKYSQYARADQYGRLYTTDGNVTPATGLVGNPDLAVLVRFLDLQFLELGAEGEVAFPVEPSTAFSTTAGLVIILHYAPWLRLDTGAYLTGLYSSPARGTVEFPFELWFQTGKFPLWFGPLSGLRTTGSVGPWIIPLGFGAGYALTKDIDLRAEVLIPQINVTPGVRDMGVGAGGEVRF